MSNTTWEHGGNACDDHAEKLFVGLGNRIRFYLTDNTPILGNYTLCEAHSTGCKNPATYAYDLAIRYGV